MTRWWRTYGKVVVAIALTLIGAVQAALSDHHVSTVEGLQIGINVTTALLVWVVPIHPEWPWAKSVVAIVLAILNAATTAVVGGVHSGDLTQLVISLATILGVSLAPADSTVRAPLTVPTMRAR